jgi:hypothetical protein
MEKRGFPEFELVDDASSQVTDAGIKGVSSFLRAVCLPGLQELGYMIQDKVRYWRLNNVLRMLEKAKGRMSFDKDGLNLTANPRVGLSIINCSSEVDNDELQELWAGLFVSSCSVDGLDDSNMNFVDLLKRMSSVEARILDYACRHCKKVIFPNKLIVASDFVISFDELSKIAKTNDIYRLDSELDHMRSIEILVTASGFGDGGGFDASDNDLSANITPSALALHLYYKTHSTGSTPVEFWGKELIPSTVIESDENRGIADARVTGEEHGT